MCTLAIDNLTTMIHLTIGDERNHRRFWCESVKQKPRERPSDSVTFFLKRTRRRQLDLAQDTDKWRATTVTSYEDTPSSSIGLPARGVTSTKCFTGVCGLGSRTQHHMCQTDNCDIQADSTPFQAVSGTKMKHTTNRGCW
jgi:hypothetical protein